MGSSDVINEYKTNEKSQINAVKNYKNRRRLLVRDLNPCFLCTLCDGYLIDATAIIICLHTFCRSCIVRYLELQPNCPTCDIQIHKNKPLSQLRSDRSLQLLLFKLIPSVYQNEVKRRQEFYYMTNARRASSSCSEDSILTDSETNRDQSLLSQYDFDFFSPDDSISLSLEYYNENKLKQTNIIYPHKRFLQCPAGVNIKHLTKFIRMKYGLSAQHRVDIIYEDEVLPKHYTLMDVAYTFKWNRTQPMQFMYRIFESSLNQRPPSPKPAPPIRSPTPPPDDPDDDLSEFAKKRDLEWANLIRQTQKQKRKKNKKRKLHAEIQTSDILKLKVKIHKHKYPSASIVLPDLTPKERLLQMRQVRPGSRMEPSPKKVRFDSLVAPKSFTVGTTKPAIQELDPNAPSLEIMLVKSDPNLTNLQILSESAVRIRDLMKQPAPDLIKIPGKVSLKPNQTVRNIPNPSAALLARAQHAVPVVSISPVSSKSSVTTSASSSVTSLPTVTLVPLKLNNETMT